MTHASFPNRSTQEKDVCQICKKPNHIAMGHWRRFNHTYQPDKVPQSLAALTVKIQTQIILVGFTLEVHLL